MSRTQIAFFSLIFLAPAIRSWAEPTADSLRTQIQIAVEKNDFETAHKLVREAPQALLRNALALEDSHASRPAYSHDSLLHTCISVKCSQKLFELLVKACDMRCFTHRNWVELTPIMKAINYGEFDKVEFLLRYMGSSHLALKDMNGKTALDLLNKVKEVPWNSDGVRKRAASLAQKIAVLPAYIRSTNDGSVYHGWKNDEFTVIQLNTADHTDGYGAKFAWRRDQSEVWFPLEGGGAIKYSDGTFVGTSTLTTASHSGSLGRTLDDTLRVVYDNSTFMFPEGTRLSAISATERASISNAILDGHQRIAAFPNDTRVLYFAMNTNDGKIQLLLDLPYPTRNPRKAEVLVKRAGKIEKVKIKDIYCTGDGVIYIKGELPDGTPLEAYWPTNSLVHAMRKNAEILSRPSEFPQQIKIFRDGLKKFFPKGEVQFLKVGDQHWRGHDSLTELTPGSEPRSSSVEEKTIYRSLGETFDLNWQQRYFGQGIQMSLNHSCVAILRHQAEFSQKRIH